MSENQRQELVRLQIASLRQGGMLSRKLDAIQKDHARHAEADSEMFLTLADRHGKTETNLAALKTEIGWMKRVGSFLIGAVGLGHFLK